MSTMADYRDLVGRLDYGRASGNDVSFSPDEAWVLREHIRALEGPRCTCPVMGLNFSTACQLHGPGAVGV